MLFFLQLTSFFPRVQTLQLKNTILHTNMITKRANQLKCSSFLFFSHITELQIILKSIFLLNLNGHSKKVLFWKWTQFPLKYVKRYFIRILFLLICICMNLGWMEETTHQFLNGPKLTLPFANTYVLLPIKSIVCIIRFIFIISIYFSVIILLKKLENDRL